ncbi:MAG: DUF2125 domain-containing protein [Propylenella sp.]
MRSLIAVLVIAVILALAWSGGWFWFAGLVERNADSVFAEIARRGVEVDCSDRSVVGFPFAVRFACGKTAVAERSTGTRANLGMVTGGASVFAPTKARIDMSSPVEVQSPHLEAPTEIRWRDAALDVGIGLNGPRDVSFDAVELSAEFALADLPDPGVAAAHAAGTLSPSENGGTDAAVTFTDLALSADGARFPMVSGSASGHLSVSPRALLAGRAGLVAPISARAIDIDLDSGGARFGAEGELSVDAEGVVDGAITLRIAGIEALPEFIAALPPQTQGVANGVVGALYAFGRPTTVDGEPGSEIVVQIERGSARVGLFEFELPRVPL